MASSVDASAASSTTPSSPYRSVQTGRADVHAEALRDTRPVAERELRAAAAGVENDHRAVSEIELRRRSEVGEPSFLLAADHLDIDPRAVAHSVDERGTVGREPQPSRADGGDRLDLRARASSTMPAIACAVRRIGSSPSRPVAVEALAEPGDLGAIDDRSPPTVGCALTDVELDRVRADVDDRVAPRAEPDQRVQLAGDAHVSARHQAQLAHRRDHAIRILGLHGHGLHRIAIGSQLRELRHAASDREARPPLVHPDRQQVGARLDDLGNELIERVLAALEHSGRRAERLEHRSDLDPRHRKRRLHDRSPLLEAVVVDTLQALDVHERRHEP